MAMLALISCSDEVQFNTPGFQGNKNYNLWRATYYNGTTDENGKLTISAGNNNEAMTFILTSSNTGRYVLSDMSASRANFIDFEEISYSTANTPDPSVTLYPEIGEVIISESTNNTVSGTFRFIAFTADGLQSVGFNEGDFYRIPVN
jgi:hypothetical protein